jgi:PAS domain S-box-containing protein
VLDREGRYLLWNHAMERFAGKTAAEVLGRRALDVFPFLRDYGLDVAVKRALAGETVVTSGVAQIEPDGTRKVYDRMYLPLRLGGAEEVSGVVAVVRDETARYAAQDALLQSQATLRMAAEAAGVGLWSWDVTTDAVVWEDAMCAIFGLAPGSAPAGRDGYLALIHPEDRPKSGETIARGVGQGGWDNEFRIVRPDGVVRWVTSKARVLDLDGRGVVLGAVFDVTEAREREERQRSAQRLEAVGQLTAGIAHNFNNLLMGLMPNLELAVRRAPQELVPLLHGAEHSARRAADLVRQLMTYAGRGRGATRRVEPLSPLVDRTVAFCRTTFDRRITIEVACRAAAAASIDASQIEQALLNLLINARDALEGAGVALPTITVSTEIVGPGAAALEGRTGDWVRVEVTDNGVGMDAATAQRVYEPFFTTKEVGKGTGLGLSTTHGIVREHGGFITCRSERGRGTAFALFLPSAAPGAPEAVRDAPEAARDARPSPPQPVAPSAVAPSERPRGGRVLVVDDEEPVRRVIARMLEEGGFDVHAVASGAEALHAMSDPSFALGVDVVLLDVSMPGLSGPEVRLRLRDLAPHARIVFLTGYPYQAEGGDAVLEKPLSRQQLVSALGAARAART